MGKLVSLVMITSHRYRNIKGGKSGPKNFFVELGFIFSNGTLPFVI